MVADITRVDVPRFRPDDRVGQVAERLRASGQDWGAVVSDSGVLLGRVRVDRIARNADAAQPAAAVMEEGPATYRPDVPLEELLQRMQEKEFTKAFVTAPEGILIGLVTREDIEAVFQNGHRPGIGASPNRSVDGGETK